MVKLYIFFMVIIFSHIVFLVIINLFVFLIPVDSGERVFYVITVLLSFTVFVSIVTIDTSKSSVTVSLFSVYMLTILVSRSEVNFFLKWLYGEWRISPNHKIQLLQLPLTKSLKVVNI